MILGIDEVGRGPIAGPLVIGAVVIGDQEDEFWLGVKDSKQLSRKRRLDLDQKIREKSDAVGLGWITPAEFDVLGVMDSLALATTRAISNLLGIKSLADLDSVKELPFSEIIIDGNTNFLAGTPLEDRVTTLVKGDDLIKEISAASIVAKVAHDEYMFKCAERYPEYGFESHVGYGTAGHQEKIREYGVLVEHRISIKPCKDLVDENQKQNVLSLGLESLNNDPNSRYLFGKIDAVTLHQTNASRGSKRHKNNSSRVQQHAENGELINIEDRMVALANAVSDSEMVPENKPSSRLPRNIKNPVNTTEIGQKAERIVIDYLLSQGHTLVAHNFKTKHCEIDVVTFFENHLYYTEVKYRKTSRSGTPLEAVNAAKRQQMVFAATIFMKYVAKQKKINFEDVPSPILAVASVSGANFSLDKWMPLYF